MADQNDVIEQPRMSKAEAQDIFNRVITNTVTYKRENGVLLFRLDKERGWEALGYKSWRECALEMGTQMGIQQSTVYNLRDWAEVNDNLSRGTGKVVQLPEMHALALKDLQPEQQVLAFTEATAGREDQRPAAIVFERAARKVAPAAPKKKRKAQRDDSDGWTKEDLEKDEALAAALKTLGSVWGLADLKAVQNGTIGLSRADILLLAKQSRPELLEVQDLIMGNRWSAAQALKFITTMPDENSTLEEMQNYCLSTKGKFFEATINGFTHTVKANKAALRR
jgi:hypothetical protein